DMIANFNPRSPRGERRYGILRLVVCKMYFNPRSPRGERREPSVITDAAKEFQSTLPARGATRFAVMIGDNLIISIHAPREGSDSRFQC
ncbi:MAG: hypothetical protein WCQ72_06400, partial [Eubacteriales bacterium]